MRQVTSFSDLERMLNTKQGFYCIKNPTKKQQMLHTKRQFQLIFFCLSLSLKYVMEWTWNKLGQAANPNWNWNINKYTYTQPYTA